MTLFKSLSHPGSSPAPLVYGRSLVRPLAFCMLPLMIFASLNVLTGVDPFSLLLWSVPGAYLLATAWTFYTLQGTLAEIILHEGAAAVRTVWEVASKKKDLRWWYILGVKANGSGLLVTVGHTVYDLQADDWPSLSDLRSALEEAATEAALRHRG